MPISITTLTLFLSSPSDLAPERAVVKRILDNINKSISPTQKLRIELWGWEDSAVPGVALTPQSVIERQIPEHDIYVGLMWKRFGTATEEFGSGTEQEFRRSLASHHENAAPRDIIFLFKTSIEGLDTLDIEQYTKVVKFKDELGELGVLHNTFREIHDLEELLTINLTKIALSWATKQLALHQPTNEVSVELVETDDELGFLDLLEEHERHFSLATDLIEQISEALTTLAEDTDSSTQAMNEATEKRSASTSLARRYIDTTANDMDRFVSLATPLLAEMKEHFSRGVKAMKDLLAFHDVIFDASTREVQISSFNESMIGLLTSMDQSDVGMTDLQATMLGLPKFSLRFNRSRRSLIAFIVEYISTISDLRSLTLNLVATAKSIK